MKNRLCVKVLCFNVVLLLLGMTVSGIISANNSSLFEYDKIKIKSRAYGIRGEERTIELDNKGIVSLESIFDEFEEKISKVTSNNQAVLLYRTLLHELDNIGLLPRGIKANEVFTTILNGYSKVSNNNRFDRILSEDSDCSNVFCLISGESNYTRLFPHFMTLYTGMQIFNMKLNSTLSGLGLKNLAYKVCMIISIFTILFVESYLKLLLLSPFSFMNYINYGTSYLNANVSDLSQGWVSTTGAGGTYTCNGTLIGNIEGLPRDRLLNNYFDIDLHPGVLGFNGIEIEREDNNKIYYIGFALFVDISKL